MAFLKDSATNMQTDDISAWLGKVEALKIPEQYQWRMGRGAFREWYSSRVTINRKVPPDTPAPSLLPSRDFGKGITCCGRPIVVDGSKPDGYFELEPIP